VIEGVTPSGEAIKVSQGRGSVLKGQPGATVWLSINDMSGVSVFTAPADSVSTDAAKES
jgi:hypothetical protein